MSGIKPPVLIGEEDECTPEMISMSKKLNISVPDENRISISQSSISQPSHYKHWAISVIRSNQSINHNEYTLITNLMHWLLFIRKILLSFTCFEHHVIIFRRT